MAPRRSLADSLNEHIRRSDDSGLRVLARLMLRVEAQPEGGSAEGRGATVLGAQDAGSVRGGDMPGVQRPVQQPVRKDPVERVGTVDG